MSAGEAFFGLVMLIILGGVVTIFVHLTISPNFDEFDINKYNRCVATCEPNEGIKTSYLDGDCDCKNGASFSWYSIQDREQR